jgi:hypothetical protein
MTFIVSGWWKGSMMISSSPRCSAPQLERVIMGGETVNSNWISLLMSAKKLYFIRSCSRS